MARKRRPLSLALDEFSDRDLLNVVVDYEDEKGYVSVDQVATAIGLDHRHRNQCVGARFAWLARGGLMQRDETTRLWRLTPVGRKFAFGTLAADEADVFKHLGGEQLMEATYALAGRYRRTNGAAAFVMRRAWIYGTSPKRFAQS